MAEAHPGEAILQHYADGELKEAAAAEVRVHLEACAECRGEVEALQQTWAECAKYRDDLLPGVYTPPPRPWVELFGERTRTPATRSENAGAMRRPVSLRAWAIAAALMVLAFGIFLRFQETPSVQAAELLRKAAAAVPANAPPGRIEVRTRTQRFVRAANHSGASAVKSLQTRFQAAHYDWDDPLSARSFAAWREQLTEKRDQVVRERNVYRIRTDTSRGELMTASLALSVEDLRPVEERFEFRDHDWVELSDAGVSAPAPVTPKLENRVEHEPTASSAGTKPVTPVSAGDELRVFAVLHRLGADLGDPVEVVRSGGEVRVTAAGISAQRQQQLREGLSSLPYVDLQFSQPAAPKLEPRQQIAPDTTANNDISQLQARLAERMGGREHFEEVAAEVLDLSETMMAHAYALRRLAEHFPVSAEAELSAADLDVLNGLRREHEAALRRSAARMNDLLKPILSQAGSATTPGSGLNPPGTWQQSTERLFQTARRVDRLSAMLFGNTPDDTAGAQAPAELRSSLAELLEHSVR